MLILVLDKGGHHQDAAQDEEHEGEMAGKRYDFYLLAHEHLYVFRKPAKGEKMSELRNNVKWR